MRTLLFNPYTGRPRDPRDIQSDPAGILMVDPDEPLRPARQAGETIPLEPLREMLADTREAFDAAGAETPQVVRDVIEYVESAVEVFAGRLRDRAATTERGKP